MIEPLARQHTAIAPNLGGHGASVPGAGDDSLGALAAGPRDLLFALGHQGATLVWHSLGGRIAMQFAYQQRRGLRRVLLAQVRRDTARREQLSPELRGTASVDGGAGSHASD